MKCPTKCPICKSKLQVRDSYYYSCKSQDHILEYRIDRKYVYYFTLKIADLTINWNPILPKFFSDNTNDWNEPTVNIVVSRESTIIRNTKTLTKYDIPYFTPDFSDLPALIAKINTYIIFR